MSEKYTPAVGRRNRYRLSEVDWKGLLLPYDGLCWICRDAEATDVDHDHGCCDSQDQTCGSCLRGALCHGCNINLGFFEKGRRGGKAETWAKRYAYELDIYLGA